MMKKTLLTVCLLAGILIPVHAQYLFDFKNDADLYGTLDNQPGPISFTNNGLTATFTASDGEMNRTTEGFGINSSLPFDDTDAFEVGEWIDITFDADVTLTNVDVASWSAGSDEATIYVDEVSSGTITSSGAHTFDINVSTGQVLRISGTSGLAGNGWFLDSIAVELYIPEGNSAPTFSTINDQTVITSNELSFTVSASDINGDDITLSASNLPPGAVFSTVTNAAAVTNTFIWTSAAPTGTYTTTFYADDGTTNTSETVLITVRDPSILIITEVADPAGTGGGNYRFVELQNIGKAAIDLAEENWFLSMQANGSTWYDVALTGIVASKDTYIVAYNVVLFEAVYGFTPDQVDSDINGTGNDAYFLYSGGDHSTGTLIDIYGEIDTDGAETAWEYTDSQAVRNTTDNSPSSTWIASQWDIINGAATNDMTPGIAFLQPPVLDPIGNQSVLEEQTLSFSVIASDPVDGDTITLTATNLPTGASFIDGTFTWASASPKGEYEVTFTATDKDGSDSETITVTVIEKPLLMLSEIADPAGSGGGDYRFVELYNAGTNTIDLAADNWTLSMQDNGDTNDWRDVTLTGSIGPTETYIVAYSSTNFLAAYGFEPDLEAANVIEGNGRDTYALFYGGDHSSGLLIDIYGEIDVDGQDTAWDYEDDRAERNNPVLEPNPVWTASEWTISVYTATNEFSPGLHGPEPEFIALEDQLMTLGSNLTLTVTATNVVYSDEIITLSATELPDGATFPQTIGTGTVSSVLSWTPADTGYYTATFAAAGIVDTTTASITIHVIPGESPEISLAMPSGGPITIAWPTTAGSGFNVLTNADLTNTNGWGDANLTPFMDGDNYKVTNSIGSESVLFYKLESE